MSIDFIHYLYSLQLVHIIFKILLLNVIEGTINFEKLSG